MVPENEPNGEGVMEVAGLIGLLVGVAGGVCAKLEWASALSSETLLPYAQMYESTPIVSGIATGLVTFAVFSGCFFLLEFWIKHSSYGD